MASLLTNAVAAAIKRARRQLLPSLHERPCGRCSDQTTNANIHDNVSTLNSDYQWNEFYMHANRALAYGDTPNMVVKDNDFDGLPLGIENAPTDWLCDLGNNVGAAFSSNK